jgi:hypothetical protein
VARDKSLQAQTSPSTERGEIDLAQAMLPLSESNGRREMSTGPIGYGEAARPTAKGWGVRLAGGAGVAAWEPSVRQ